MGGGGIRRPSGVCRPDVVWIISEPDFLQLLFVGFLDQMEGFFFFFWGGGGAPFMIFHELVSFPLTQNSIAASSEKVSNATPFNRFQIVPSVF